MKFKKAMNLLLILLFFAALLVPLVTSDFQGGKVSAAENRYLATFPDIIQDGRLHLSKTEFENWINDNVGGRELASKVNTIGAYRLFGLSAKSDTLIGKDDWMFYYNEDILEDYAGVNLKSEEELASIGADLATVQRYVESTGAEFLMVVCPDKKTIYSEQYPDSILTVSDVHVLDQLQSQMETSGVNFLSLVPSLSANKDLGSLYSPRIDNAHWNYLGAYVGYEAIMQKLSELGMDVSWTPLDACTITEQTASGTFNNAITISEPSYTVTTPKTGSAVLQAEHLDAFPYLSFNQDPVQYKKYFTQEDSTLPSLLFIGDSYSPYLMEYFASSFSRTMFLHNADLTYLPNVLAQESFDVLIFERAERMLPWGYGQHHELSTLLDSLQESGAAEETLNLLAVDYADWGFHCLDFCNGVSADGLTVTVPSNREQLCLNGWALDPLAGSTASSVVVQVGDQFYEASYGHAKQSVADYFQYGNYLYSGYTAILPTEDVIEAGSFTIHVISADGTYRYPPQTYHIEVLP